MSDKEKAVPGKIALKDEIVSLAAKLEKEITLDKKSGVGSAKDDLYESNLPEDLTMAEVKKVSDYNTSFAAAGTLAFGNLSVAAMAGNKSLETTSIDIKMGVKDNLAIGVARTKEYANRLGGADEIIVKHGEVTVGYKVRAGKNAGQLKAARQQIAELAASKLK